MSDSINAREQLVDEVVGRMAGMLFGCICEAIRDAEAGKRDEAAIEAGKAFVSAVKASIESL